MRQTDQLAAHMLILLATVLIAGSFLVSKTISHVASPVVLSFIRFGLAALVLLPLVLSRRTLRQQIRRVLPRCMLISLFYAGFFSIQFLAIQTSTALNISALYTLTPLVTALLAIVFFKERIGLVRSITYLLGGAGTLIVIFEGDVSSIYRFVLSSGDYLFFLAIVCIAMFNICLRKLYRNDSIVVITFCNMLGGAFWMALVTLVLGIPVSAIHFTLSDFANLLYLAIFATLGTSYLYQRGVVTLSPSAVSSYIYLSPACVALLSLAMYNDTIEPLVWLGIGISAFATVALQWLIARQGR